MDVNPNSNEDLVLTNEAAVEGPIGSVEGTEACDAEGKEEVTDNVPLVDPIAV